MAILKLKKHDEDAEIKFELAALKKLSIAERFQIMFEKNKILRELEKQSGIIQTPQIIKRK